MAGRFWEKAMNLDRRWIYLVIGMVTFLPMLVMVDMPVQITSEVKSVFDRVESLPEGTVIMVPMDIPPIPWRNCSLWPGPSSGIVSPGD